MQYQIKKAINLAKKTGDKIIIIDILNPDDIFVIMDLDQYEKIVLGQNEIRSLTENELLDKINRDIAIWKSENDNGKNINYQSSIKNYSEKNWPYKYEDNNMEEENTYYYNEEEKSEEKRIIEKNSENDKSSWEIPQNIKKRAEEII